MTLEELEAGGKRALAQALVQIESDPDGASGAALLDAAWARPRGAVLGLTGPPGVGKSTLTDALIRAWRAAGQTIAVIAVDPSSARTGGALLGDRTRLTTDPADKGVFVRSMAARDRLGGVAEITFPAAVLLRAFFDLVVVETVGIGQSETEIAQIADRIAFLAQPGSGDALQYMKAGIIEIPDLVIVTKADMGTLARRTAADLRGALSLTPGRTVPVLQCSATTGQGIDDVVAQIRADCADAARFATARDLQIKAWVKQQLTTRFGSEGYQAAKDSAPDLSTDRPFGSARPLIIRLETALSAAFQ